MPGFAEEEVDVRHFPRLGGWIVQSSTHSGNGLTKDEAIDDWADSVRQTGGVGMKRVLDAKVERLKRGGTV